MSSSPVFWRLRSSAIARATSGSASASVRHITFDFVSMAMSLPFCVLGSAFVSCNLIEAALMTPAFELRIQPEADDLVSQPEGDNAAAHREHVRVVVLSRKPRRVQIVAQRRPDPRDLVGRDLLALAAAAEHDAAVGASVGARARDADTHRRIVR